MKNRKTWAFAALFVVACGGLANAGMYTMNAWTAAQLRAVSWSDTQSSTANYLRWVGYHPGTADSDRVYGTGLYGGNNPTGETRYAVGFSGDLTDQSPYNGEAWVKIGAKANTNGVLTAINALPNSFDGFYLPISNDNNTGWSYKLYVTTATGSYENTLWTSTLSPGTQTTVTLNSLTGNLPSSVDFSDVTDIGLAIRWSGANGSGDTFHTSIVPVPAGVLLGFLGLGVAGLGLRRKMA